MSRIPVRGIAVASATAVAAVGAMVGVNANAVSTPTADDSPENAAMHDALVASQLKQHLGQQIQHQADAQAQAAAKKAAAEAAAKKAAAEAAAKKAAEREAAQAISRSASRGDILPTGDVQKLARSIIGSDTQFACFSNIIERESGWNVHATNPSSGAYGLAQALPGSKMASAGSDWRDNPETQIKWAIGYMNNRYGGICQAWSYWQAHGNY